MAEQKYVDVKFRGKTYRITAEHAHMLARRGHLRIKKFGFPIPAEYSVEDDRMIEVRGEPLPGAISNHE